MRSRFVLFFLLISLISFSQTKKDLEESKVANIKDIEEATKLLQSTRENKKKTISELRIINKRIELRENLIADIERQIIEVESSIAEKEQVIESLQKDLVEKKKEYEDLILLAFKNKNAYSDIMYVLAADDFNKAYKRYKYLKRITDYRKQQAELIMEIKRVQEQKLLELTVIKQQKEVLLLQRKEEFANLTNEKTEKGYLVNSLSNKEKQLKDELAEKEKVLKKIEDEIRKIIEAETRKANSGRLYERLTPQERIISSEFEKNRGTLPWPTYQGIVTSKFGEHDHPVLRGIKTKNNGVDITSVKNSEVKAIFNGEVSLIAAIPGGNYAVIIRHGNYFSVYQNVVKVRVKQGDKVSTNEKIGVVYSGEEENSGILHFELRKEFTKLNPEEWLAR
jgi:septal ring factor EnvC (AmiA/AmiB activator)